MVQLERKVEIGIGRATFFLVLQSLRSVLSPPSYFRGGLLGCLEQPDSLEMRCYPLNHDIEGPNWQLGICHPNGLVSMVNLLKQNYQFSNQNKT